MLKFLWGTASTSNETIAVKEQRLKAQQIVAHSDIIAKDSLGLKSVIEMVCNIHPEVIYFLIGSKKYKNKSVE